MGGQACILYGAAEFSRDVNFAVAVSDDNLDRFRRALTDLEAVPIFFPPPAPDVLRRGHACHFRSLAPDLENLRVDVMHVMRGAAPFAKLWARRSRVRVPGLGAITVMSLPDLVQIKKTQRDKDWPMVRRLIEADFASAAARSKPSQRSFWLRECRTPELLIRLAKRFPGTARRMAKKRTAVAAALRARQGDVEHCLAAEERRERQLDRAYWKPLRAELELWRTERPRASSR